MGDDRPFLGEHRNDLPHSQLRARQSREALVFLGHEPAGCDGDVFVVGLLGHHPLEALLVRRLCTRFGQFVERQPVNDDAPGYSALSATFDLTIGAEVGTSLMPKPTRAACPESSSPLNSLDRKNLPGRIPASSAMSRKFHAPDRASGFGVTEKTQGSPLPRKPTSPGRVRRAR